MRRVAVVLSVACALVVSSVGCASGGGGGGGGTPIATVTPHLSVVSGSLGVPYVQIDATPTNFPGSGAYSVQWRVFDLSNGGALVDSGSLLPGQVLASLFIQTIVGAGQLTVDVSVEVTMTRAGENAMGTLQATLNV